MRKILVMMAVIVVATQVLAKLPAPTEEAKTTALEIKAKAAWSDKVAAYQLCLAQDKVAAQYMKAKGAEAKPAAAMPVCQSPGPYVMAEASPKVGVADALPLGSVPIKK